jgi:hypothetical protein
MRQFCATIFVPMLLISGCGQSPQSQIKGNWTGPLGATLTIDDTQWILSAGVIDVTLSYSIVSSEKDTVVVALKTQSGQIVNATCRVNDKTLRILQPLNTTIAVGGTWTR